MDIHLPEIFGWHPKKTEKPANQPGRFGKWFVIALLVMSVVAMAGLTAFYFSEYLTGVFGTA